MQRTRDAILRAFVPLVSDRRYEAIRIADLIAGANIGRATFYEHFRGKDDVLLAAMEPVLIPLAKAAAGQGAKAPVLMTLLHIWKKRSVGRVILNSSANMRLQRRLAAMIQARIEGCDIDAGTAAVRATAAAAAQMAMLRSWIAGEVSCHADTLAEQMINCSKLTGRT